MTSTTGQYDQSLLASAPEVTGPRRQEGYTTDLLNVNSGKITPPFTTQSDLESGLVAKEYNQQPAARPIPFWRTRKGMVIIFVAGIVILGAVIGGAVGGTAGKKGALPDANVGGGGGLSPGKEGPPNITPPGVSPSAVPPASSGTATSTSTASTSTASTSTASASTALSPTAPSTSDTPSVGGPGSEQTSRSSLNGLIVGAERAGIVERV